MNCISCSAPIQPEFVHSIQTNICPACGEEMMADATREFLDEIKEAFEKMPSNPEGLAGWLLSHYELRKIGTGEPVQEFFGTRPQMQQLRQQNAAVGDGGIEDQLRNQPKVAPNKLQQFYKQAGVTPPGMDPNQQKSAAQLAALAQQIQGEENAGDTFNNGAVDEALDPAYTQQALAAMNGTDNGGGGMMSHDDKAAMRALMAQQKQQGGMDSDAGDLPPALQQDRMDRLQKQQELSLGGSVGKITRSS